MGLALAVALFSLSAFLSLSACNEMPAPQSQQAELLEALEHLREAHALGEAHAPGESHALGESRRLFTGEFQQGWRETPEDGFEPAVAELWATAEALHVLAVLGDRDIGNRATGFNEKTWQTGDVFEVFIQVEPDTYYEFHITPENRHLFLKWTSDLREAVKRREATLEDTMIADRSFLQSETQIHSEANHWSVHARIPFDKIGLDPNRTYPDLKVAFARYDSFSDDRPPVLSATPAFAKANYHDRSAWHPIRFQGGFEPQDDAPSHDP